MYSFIILKHYKAFLAVVGQWAQQCLQRFMISRRNNHQRLAVGLLRGPCLGGAAVLQHGGLGGQFVPLQEHSDFLMGANDQQRGGYFRRSRFVPEARWMVEQLAGELPRRFA